MCLRSVRVYTEYVCTQCICVHSVPVYTLHSAHRTQYAMYMCTQCTSVYRVYMCTQFLPGASCLAWLGSRQRTRGSCRPHPGSSACAGNSHRQSLKKKTGIVTILHSEPYRHAHRHPAGCKQKQLTAHQHCRIQTQARRVINQCTETSSP